ncbi:MAG: MerR family transcriptional regulator [Nitrosomonadaceae bacterium]|nr:MerR family transcriptional regulator [Nitrosomonadaceae bacterium]|tara:strand:- start:4473 stop:4862 length:390 start_codon:yes stop_codon:yes gene_type:complete
MGNMAPNNSLPAIPEKRYFTIGEVGGLCCVKPHVLRYWEQEFSQLNPIKRRGNRRYYQRHEVLLIRQIRELLYEQGFTINGARAKLRHSNQSESAPDLIDNASVTEHLTPVNLSILQGEIKSVVSLLRS